MREIELVKGFVVQVTFAIYAQSSIGGSLKAANDIGNRGKPYKKCAPNSTVRISIYSEGYGLEGVQ